MSIWYLSHNDAYAFGYSLNMLAQISWGGGGGGGLRYVPDLYIWDMRGSRGGTGGPLPPLKNHKNLGFLSKSGPDPLKNHQASINFVPSSARQRNVI